jgi:hypothetical protein
VETVELVVDFLRILSNRNGSTLRQQHLAGWLAVALAAMLMLAPTLGSAQGLQSPDAVALDAALAARSTTVAMVWVEETLDERRLMLRLGPSPEAGTPQRLSAPGQWPADPAVVLDDAGLAHIVWVDAPAISSTPAPATLNYTLASPGNEPVTLALHTSSLPDRPSLPQIALDPHTGMARVVWQQGSGSYQVIRTWVQELAGLGESIALTPPERPGYHVYPQVFALGPGEALATWYAFEQGSLRLKVRDRVAPGEWIPVPELEAAPIPVDRLPVIFAHHQMLEALYADADRLTRRDLLHAQSLHIPAAPSTLSLPGPGQLRLPGVSTSAEGVLVSYLRETAEGATLEAVLLASDVSPAGVASATPTGIRARFSQPLGTAVAGAQAMLSYGVIHLIWWTDLIDGGDGDLRAMIIPLP